MTALRELAEKGVNVATFIRTGIQDAKDKFIDPEPTQTNTGNCAAYASASALFALNLDRTLGLDPAVSQGTADERFQVGLARMVERITDLIYTQRLGVAGGIQKYIDERGATKSLQVTEYTGDGTVTLSGKKVSNWTYLLGRSRRAEGVIAFLDWQKKNGSKYETIRHAISLVGEDSDTHEVVAANPWGSPYATVGVGQDEAGLNTALGNVDRAHNRYAISRSGGFTYLDFHGKSARVYHLVRISKPLNKALSVKGRGGAFFEKSLARSRPAGRRRYEYQLENDRTGAIAGLVLCLPGVRERDLATLQSPAGWAAELWYRDRELFDRPPPELDDDIDESFAGVIWRPTSARAALRRGARLEGFAIEVREPTLTGGGTFGAMGPRSKQTDRALRHLSALVRRAKTWKDDGMGRAIVLQLVGGEAAARHIRVVTPHRFCEVPAAAHDLERLLSNWHPPSTGPVSRRRPDGRRA